MSSITDMPLKHLFSKVDGKVNDEGIDTSENFTAEKLKYQVVRRDLKRTEEKIVKDRETRGTGIILFTIIIRIITAIEVIDHG